jgi:MoaA/NifB/PqqE/SkfB family radical SAM enzyme
MSKFCPLPFSHIAIRPNGRVFPCCNFRWDGVPEDLHLDHPDVFNHPYLENIRNQMRRGDLVDGCKNCYLSEEKTGTSMRMFVLEHMHKADMPSEPTNNPKITYIDLALSNACNNKCRMCNADLSTSWYSDWKALHGSIPKGLLQKPQNKLDNIDFSNLRFLKLIGGEPLMEQEKFIDILRKCNREKLSILLTTNTTLTPNDELFGLMKECALLKVNLSIDATESLNDFLRKGSKWEKTVEVIDWFSKNFNKNDVNVVGVVNIYNVNCLDKLYHFLQDKFPSVSLTYIMVDGPDWMSPKHLPEDVKSKILEKIDIWQKEKDVPIWNLLRDELAKNGDFREFMRKDKQLNDLRKEFWGEHNKELYEMVKHFYE